MTAEVAVLNKNGVALAADSAVTIDRGGGPKIFNTAEKLFALHRTQPIGIMVYSSAEVLAVPVEVAIKEFRSLTSDKSFESVDDIAKEFQRFLCYNKDIFTDRLRRDNLKNSVLNSIRNIVNITIRESLAERASIEALTSRFETQLLEFISIAEQRSSQTKGHDSGTEGSDSEELDAQAMAEEMMDAHELPTQHIDLLTRLVEAVSIYPDTLNDVTGFVIAGFGSKQYFPSISSFEFGGSYRSRHRMINMRHSSIADDSDALIAPFAQTDVMSSFVQGVNPRLDRDLVPYVRDYLTEVADTLASESGDGELARIIVEQLKDRICQDLGEWKRKLLDDECVSPLMSTVATLPKVELAELADSLVTLTALKRRMTPDAESVGPPIDVAVISRGDGFVWIRRKHYFDAGVNPGYIKYRYGQ